MTDWIYRVDFAGLDAAGASTDFSYATHSYTAPASHATKPNEWFDGRLDQPLLLRRDLYGQGRTYGDVQVPHGTVVLNNSDGGLDGLLAYGFDAQTIEVWKVDPAALGTDLLEFRGSMEQLLLDEGSVTILVRDVTYGFDRALQPTKYLGNNAGSAGLEGSAELTGRPKPILLGSVYNIEPVLVNRSRLIYQFHDDEKPVGGGINLQTGLFVYDGMVELSFGVSRTLTEMQNGATALTVSSIDTATNVITFTGAHGLLTTDPVHVAATSSLPGGVLDTQYYYARSTAADKVTLHPTSGDAAANTNIVDITSTGAGTITVAKNRTAYGRADASSSSSGCFIRLGSEPTRRVTMTVEIGANATTDCYWYDVFEELANRVGTFGVDYRITAPAAALPVGHFWRDEISAYGALLEVCRNANASFQVYPNRGGASPVYLSLQRLTAPAAPERLALTESNIIAGSLRRVVPVDQDRGTPPWRVRLEYVPNGTIMTATDIAAAAQSANRNLVFAYIGAIVQDVAAIQLKFPAAPERQAASNIPSLVNGMAVAGSLPTNHADYLSDLYSVVDRNMYTLDVALSEIEDLLDTTGGLSIPGLLLNDVVKVTYPRFGLDSGKYLAVLGYTEDRKAGVAQLTLWG